MTRDALSTKKRAESVTDTACDASPGLSSLRPVPSKPDAIEVRVVRILALLAAAGGDVEHARLVVDAFDGGGDELAFGDAILQRAGRGVVEIEVAPAVAFGPEDQVGAAVDEPQRLRLDVGVQALLDRASSPRRSPYRRPGHRAGADRG